MFFGSGRIWSENDSCNILANFTYYYKGKNKILFFCIGDMTSNQKRTIDGPELSIKSFWLKLWKLLAPSQRQFKLLLGFIFVFEAVRLAGPYLLKLIIDRITNFQVSEIQPILYLIALMLLSEQVVSVLSYFKDRIIFKILVNIEYYLPLEAQKKMVYLSLDYHEKENTGNKITKIERGLNKIVDLLANMSWEVMPTIAQMQC